MAAVPAIVALRETSPRLEVFAAPAHVREWLDRSLGSPIVEARTQAGGFSPGIAARLRCADGTRAFVKAVGVDRNPHTLQLFRDELAALTQLPPSPLRPRLLDGYDAEAWVGLLLEEVPGQLPQLPWRPDELDRVLAALVELEAELCPAHWPGAPRAAETQVRFFTGWQQLADEGRALDDWSDRNLGALIELEQLALAAIADEQTICHIDVRSDNLLLTPDRVVFVDWASAAVGPSWLDAALFMLEVRAAGEVDTDAIVRRHPPLRDVDPVLLTATWAALAGMFVRSAGLPPPPGLPTLRTFQGAYATSTLAWTRERTGFA